MIRDIRDKRFYSIGTKEEFENTLFKNYPLTYKSALPLNMNQWTYVSSLRAAQIRKDNTKEGWASINLGSLKVGDVVNVSVEFFNISGAKPFIAIYDNDVTEHSITSVSSNEWEVLTLKYIVQSNNSQVLYVGLLMALSGEFLMRNIKCEVLTQDSTVVIGSNEYGEYIKYSDGRMECVGKISEVGKANQAWGNLFYILLNPKPYPIPFFDKPKVALGNTGKRMGLIGSFYNVSDSDEFPKANTPRLELYRGVADTSDEEYEVSYIAKGRWKE